MAKVSICIPAYKDVAGIDRLLRSIQTSDYTDIEIILTDDTPDQSVYEIVKKYITEVSEENTETETIKGFMISVCGGMRIPFIYIRHTVSLGPGENWNHAISLARTDYIKIMHQDDWFTTTSSLTEFVEMLDNAPDAVLAYSGSRQVTIKHSDPYDISDYYDRWITDEHKATIDADSRDLYIGQYIGAPSAVIYRNCDLRFDPKLSWLIDVDFYIGLLSGGKAVCTTDPLVCIGVSDTQLTESRAGNKDINIFEYRYIYQKYDLGRYDKYRNKLVQICVDFGGRFSEISDLGISRSEYNYCYFARKKRQCRFYFLLILKKLGLRKAEVIF